jgi:hypothetical protein
VLCVWFVCGVCGMWFVCGVYGLCVCVWFVVCVWCVCVWFVVCVWCVCVVCVCGVCVCVCVCKFASLKESDSTIFIFTDAEETSAIQRVLLQFLPSVHPSVLPVRTAAAVFLYRTNIFTTKMHNNTRHIEVYSPAKFRSVISRKMIKTLCFGYIIS